MLDVDAVIQLHHSTVERWHRYEEVDNPYEDLLELVCRQHEQNYRLWHREDIARSPDVADADLAQVKRDIDAFNQRRNDLIEQLDDALIQRLVELEVQPAADAQLNSETPGSVIDRLSIISLRIYHMEEQAARLDASEQHRQKAKQRLEVIYEQRADLATSLDHLLHDIAAGRKLLKVYRQFKMYNDPSMNPYLYQAKTKPAA